MKTSSKYFVPVMFLSAVMALPASASFLDVAPSIQEKLQHRIESKFSEEVAGQVTGDSESMSVSAVITFLDEDLDNVRLQLPPEFAVNQVQDGCTVSQPDC